MLKNCSVDINVSAIDCTALNYSVVVDISFQLSKATDCGQNFFFLEENNQWWNLDRLKRSSHKLVVAALHKRP